MFTAATPAAPTPWPTKIPSIVLMADMATEPSRVGIRSLRKSENTPSLSKSIASLFITVYTF